MILQTIRNSSVLEFLDPRIGVGIYIDRIQARKQLILTGCTLVDPDGRGREIEIRGLGEGRLGDFKFVIRANELVVNDTSIASRPNGHRNAVLDPSGHVDLDVFLPFELPYYPKRKGR